jgi:hypothetical protein
MYSNVLNGPQCGSVKDTFMSVFPGYGVSPDITRTNYMKQHAYNEWNALEGKRTIEVDKRFHNKLDEVKYFTECLLRTADMRGRK